MSGGVVDNVFVAECGKRVNKMEKVQTSCYYG